MPVALILELIQALAALAPQVPAVLDLLTAANAIVTTGAVTPEQEAEARAAIDAAKASIDTA